MPKELNYMEYATDGAAQAAYVSSDVAGYGSDVLTGGTPSASHEYSSSYNAAKACDDNEGTRWSTGDPRTPPFWWKYDFGAGVTKIVRKLRAKGYADYSFNAFKLQGSNNNVDWDDVLSDNMANTSNWQEFTFANSTAYRYYKILGITLYNATSATYWEFEMMEYEIHLQCYSEDTIKQQGSYSLKVFAQQTGSLNDTLTKSGLSINLSGYVLLKLYVYASRTGTNIEVKIHDSGGTTTTINIVITSANTWTKITKDISGVADADKDNIDSIIIKIIEASADNTFFVDNFYGLLRFPYPTARLNKNRISGYHCFMDAYMRAKREGFDPLKLPDGTIF